MTLQRAIEVADLVLAKEDVARKKIFRCVKTPTAVNRICFMANSAKLAELLGVSESELVYFYINYAADFLA